MNAQSFVYGVPHEQRIRFVASLVLATSVSMALGGVMTGCEESATPTPVPFDLVTKSGLGPPSTVSSESESVAYRLFGDAESWSRYWEGAFADSVPSVRFADELVLCVYQGTKSTGGYAIEVRELYLENRALRVVLDLREPQPGDMLIQVVTDPYAIYRIQLPKDAVDVSKTSQPQLRFVQRIGDEEQKIEARNLGFP